MRDDPSPLNPVPPFALVLFLVIIGVEAAFTLGARGLMRGPWAGARARSRITAFTGRSCAG
jgi:hypothetical protein